MKIYDSPEDKIADQYFNFANDVIGILAVTLSATALQFSNPQPFAAFFFAVIFLWTVSKGSEYRKIAKHYVLQYQGLEGLVVLLWKLNIYLIGFTTLYMVAIGKLTKASIYAAWPF